MSVVEYAQAVFWLIGLEGDNIFSHYLRSLFLDLWIKKHVLTGHHVSCTAKMGPQNDTMAVVNQYGKVYGVDGLRIGDASIMPDCVRANINVTVMVVAEKIADFIKDGK